MTDKSDDDLASLIYALPMGSVIAAAGCGKTEQIAKATAYGEGRRLILTHTHAGVDALRKRLKRHNVSSTRFAIDTIAGWCLRMAASYPARSGLPVVEPSEQHEWVAVYDATVRLLVSGALNRVLRASYCGVFVDEYQDCGRHQHQVVTALARTLSVCVFGDPLQAIFDFNGEAPADWETDVYPQFPMIRTLTYPHRWHKLGNADMADWLEKVRTALEAGRAIDFGHTPDCVHWVWLPDQAGPRQSKIVATCLSVMSFDGDLVVIGDPMNWGARALIAKRLAKQGFSNIEPIDCKSLNAASRRLETSPGPQRLEATLDFLGQCIVGIGRADFVKAVASRSAGGQRGAAKFGTLIDLGLAVKNGGGDDACLALIEAFVRMPNTYIFRREMLSTMRSALTMTSAGEIKTLPDAIWHVQNRIRHAGRRIAYRSVGSTLLVKGLEFAHAIVIDSPKMNRNDWYVALTRATRTLTVLSPQKRFTPQP